MSSSINSMNQHESNSSVSSGVTNRTKSTDRNSMRSPSPLKKPQPPSNNHVSQCLYEFLLAEVLQWIELECDAESSLAVNNSNNLKGKTSESLTNEKENSNNNNGVNLGTKNKNNSEHAILSAERAAAKIERLGYGVGYRLCERLAQFKPLSTTHTQPSSYLTTNSLDKSNSTSSPINAASQSHHLEAVKFLCKEFWTEVFQKQIDKLQTNHRGIFVLKDHELQWLKRFPSEDDRARFAAIKMLAFPCGLIRGALSNLGIASVVSCDFLADGKTMSACSFNIKIKG